MELAPWLRSVPLVTLLLGFFIASALPLWTAAAVLSHSRHTSFPTNQEHSDQVSVLSEASPVFGTFVAIIIVIVLGFLLFYYKAVLRLRTIRVKLDSGKLHILDYR